MNNSAVFKTQNKLERNILKLEELKEKTQFLCKNTLRTDKSTRDWIEAKTEKFEGKISSLENKVKLQTQKLDKYMQLNTDMNNINSNLPMEHNHQIEDIMNKMKPTYLLCQSLRQKIYLPHYLRIRWLTEF